MKSWLWLTQVIHYIACKGFPETKESSIEDLDQTDESCPWGYHRIFSKTDLGLTRRSCVKDSEYECLQFSNKLGICSRCSNGYYLKRSNNYISVCSYNWCTVGIIIGVFVCCVSLGIFCCYCQWAFFCVLNIQACICCCKRKLPYNKYPSLDDQNDNYVFHTNSNLITTMQTPSQSVTIQTPSQSVILQTPFQSITQLSTNQFESQNNQPSLVVHRPAQITDVNINAINEKNKFYNLNPQHQFNLNSQPVGNIQSQQDIINTNDPSSDYTHEKFTK